MADPRFTCLECGAGMRFVMESRTTMTGDPGNPIVMRVREKIERRRCDNGHEAWISADPIDTPPGTQR